MGIATPGMHLSIVDNDGRECEPGVEGNIALGIGYTQQGDPLVGVFDGYLKEDGTKIRKVQQEAPKPRPGSSPPRQWYLTGDRGSRDEDGYFWFVGRSDDVINSAGYRIGEWATVTGTVESVSFQPRNWWTNICVNRPI